MTETQNSVRLGEIIKEFHLELLHEGEDYQNIPLRTLEDWESGKRKPPFYVIRLLEFFVDHLDA